MDVGVDASKSVEAATCRPVTSQIRDGYAFVVSDNHMGYITSAGDNNGYLSSYVG